MVTLDRVLEIFNEINSYPRCSGNREPICNYLCSFAEKKRLQYYKDDEFNVVIKKDASSGMEKAQSLILQAHTDMVCVKDEDIEHDFKKDAIVSFIDNGFLKAKGTTLGADNGIGMAIMLAFLESDTRKPALECVFTSDEETNMVGAKKLDKSILNSRYMINLDEETEKCITVSSAGIADLRLGYKKEEITEKSDNSQRKIIDITIDGLLGGHSGIDIKLGRVSAIKLISCVIEDLMKNFNIDVIDIKSGSHMNAIPKDANLIISVFNNDSDKVLMFLNEYATKLKDRYAKKEPDLKLDSSITDKTYDKKLKASFIDILVKVINELPYGVLAYDKKINEMVETSANIGRIVSDETFLKIWISIRSSVDEKLDNLIETVKVIGNKYGAKTDISFHEYGWPVNNETKLVPFLIKIKQDLKNDIPKVTGIHAGLECGTFARAIKNADICAIGPNIFHPHTTGEKTEVKSIEKFIVFLESVLNRFNEVE